MQHVRPLYPSVDSSDTIKQIYPSQTQNTALLGKATITHPCHRHSFISIIEDEAVQKQFFIISSAKSGR